MPTMSRFEAAFCRSGPWRSWARRIVLPWALQGIHPVGHVLELGAGSGAMAAELLAAYPGVTMTATDFDPTMVAAAEQRLAPYTERSTARQADATAVPFDDDTFDVVLSWIMLHHTINWEKALAEAVRVVRPGGHVVGYDLLSTAPLRALHQAEGARFRMMKFDELRRTVRELPVAQAMFTRGGGGFVVRFTLRK
jgi:ubiquinone/menaquinone biosynthesis C-methylase UbiE